ncbi:MAG: N-acetylglucosamine-specific PTS transporter subunit IIBC, partial [Bacillota bacterium]|nr:N-acetylglucosamine-specific PTS transporter subunit IIBC [Bacillota bacterium]
IFLRLGAGIPGIEGQLAQYFLKSGAAIFDNMALLFAIGIAFGLAKDNHGAAALAGAVGFFVMENVYLVANADINTGVFGGIIMGIIAGSLYNKYHDIELPEFLGFFGGRRFVPIVTGFAAVAVGILFGFIWPSVQNGLDAFSHGVVEAGAIGTFIFGFGNRLLIPVGLHHVLNSVFWFGHGAFTNAAGEVINGDLLRFLAGDPTAGAFQAGFYPIMMFGLPAGALAMYTAARDENKKMVAGLLTSVAFTSFLTGITEPIEFMFVFVAPVLYFIHALFTGIAMAITSSLGILHGFGFSAGAFDFFINMNLATKGWLLVPIGLGFGALYYFTFLFAIKKFDLQTPGREEDASGGTDEMIKKEGISELAKNYINALGGKDNLVDIDACITRLRIEVKDASIIKDEDLKVLGATGVIRPTKKNVQVVVGTKAEIIAGSMKKELK